MVNPSVSGAVRVPKTAELVAGHIRGQIVRGILQRDDSLPSETALMEQFSVSRPTLREAFRILESEGLITVRRGARGGARVLPPSTEVAARYAGLVLQHRAATLADVLDARVIVEAPAAGILAARSDRKRSARALGALLVEHPGVDDQPGFTTAFHAFNRLVVALTGNETLILLTAMLESISEAASARFGPVFAAEPEHVALLGRRAERARTRLIAHIAAGEADAAEALWRAHLTAAGRELAGTRASKVVDVLG